MKREILLSAPTVEFISAMAILPIGTSCRNWKPAIVGPWDNWGLGQIATQICRYMHIQTDAQWMEICSLEDTKAISGRDI